jgi:hypothetical protein
MRKPISDIVRNHSARSLQSAWAIYVDPKTAPGLDKFDQMLQHNDYPVLAHALIRVGVKLRRSPEMDGETQLVYFFSTLRHNLNELGIGQAQQIRSER